MPKLGHHSFFFPQWGYRTCLLASAWLHVFGSFGFFGLPQESRFIVMKLYKNITMNRRSTFHSSFSFRKRNEMKCSQSAFGPRTSLLFQRRWFSRLYRMMHFSRCHCPPKWAVPSCFMLLSRQEKQVAWPMQPSFWNQLPKLLFPFGFPRACNVVCLSLNWISPLQFSAKILFSDENIWLPRCFWFLFDFVHFISTFLHIMPKHTMQSGWNRLILGHSSILSELAQWSNIVIMRCRMMFWKGGCSKLHVLVSSEDDPRAILLFIRMFEPFGLRIRARSFRKKNLALLTTNKVSQSDAGFFWMQDCSKLQNKRGTNASMVMNCQTVKEHRKTTQTSRVLSDAG